MTQNVYWRAAAVMHSCSSKRGAPPFVTGAASSAAGGTPTAHAREGSTSSETAWMLATWAAGTMRVRSTKGLPMDLGPIRRTFAGALLCWVPSGYLRDREATPLSHLRGHPRPLPPRDASAGRPPGRRRAADAASGDLHDQHAGRVRVHGERHDEPRALVRDGLVVFELDQACGGRLNRRWNDHGCA